MMTKYPKDDWSKYDSCGNCSYHLLTKYPEGICTNVESKYYKMIMPCWHGCEKYIDDGCLLTREKGASDDRV